MTENSDLDVYVTGGFVRPIKLESGKYAWVLMSLDNEAFHKGRHISIKGEHQEEKSKLFNVVGYQLQNKETKELCDLAHDMTFQVYYSKEDLGKYLKLKNDDWEIIELRSNEIEDPEIVY